MGTQDIENLLKHGCWCAKFDHDNPYMHFLGGPQPVDKLDAICKEWFHIRHCNDQLDGGTCKSFNNELLTDGSYSIMVDMGCMEQGGCYNTTDICSSESCTIDLHYLEQLRNYMTQSDY